MSKFGKTLYWAICIGSIVLGGTLFAVGISLGGASSFSIGSDGLHFHNDYIFTDAKLDLSQSVMDETITSINLDLELTEVVVTSGDELTIAHTSDIAYTSNNNVLEITSNRRPTKRFGMYFGTVDYSFVKITIPDDVKILEIDASGKTILRDLSMDLIELSIDLGDALIENTSANMIDIEASVGNVTLNSCSFDTLQSELEMGSLLTENLEIITSAKLKNAVGSMDINLSGTVNDYHFMNAIDMGSWTVNGNRISESNGHIDIITETNMGSVNITTR